jgi:hypothetical protein
LRIVSCPPTVSATVSARGQTLRPGVARQPAIPNRRSRRLPRQRYLVSAGPRPTAPPSRSDRRCSHARRRVGLGHGRTAAREHAGILLTEPAGQRHGNKAASCLNPPTRAIAHPFPQQRVGSTARGSGKHSRGRNTRRRSQLFRTVAVRVFATHPLFERLAPITVATPDAAFRGRPPRNTRSAAVFSLTPRPASLHRPAPRRYPRASGHWIASDRRSAGPSGPMLAWVSDLQRARHGHTGARIQPQGRCRSDTQASPGPRRRYMAPRGATRSAPTRRLRKALVNRPVLAAHNRLNPSATGYIQVNRRRSSCSAPRFWPSRC